MFTSPTPFTTFTLACLAMPSSALGVKGIGLSTLISDRCPPSAGVELVNFSILSIAFLRELGLVSISLGIGRSFLAGIR